MKVAHSLIAVAAVGALALTAALPAWADVELTELDPPDGSEHEVPPDTIHFCFSESVVIEGTEAYDFTYRTSEGTGMGHRVAFQSDGLCADIFYRLPEERPAGTYTLEWRVTDADSGEETTGTVEYEITEASSGTPGEDTPGPAVTPTPTDSGGTVDEDDDPDILLLSLVTVGVVGGAAVVLTLGYFIRRRIGYEPHKPADGEEDGGENH